jgi:hypothetical protein
MKRERVCGRARRLGVAGPALAFAAGGLLALASSRAPAATPSARAAGVLNIDDTGHLHLLNASGSVFLEEGSVSGTLPGTVKVRLVVGGSVTASFTIQARGGGSITGSGSAVLHSTKRYSSFAGSLAVNRGTGGYTHAHGSGKLSGVIDRLTHALTVQTVGELHY